MNPSVSVVLSVYNNRRELPGALMSLSRQTVKDFEVIAINDGSSDGSDEVLEKFAKVDSRFRVFHQPNRGLGHSLNRGCDEAQGEFIARQDADDVSALTRLEEQTRFMRTNPKCAVSGCWTWFSDAALSIIFASQVPNDSLQLKGFLSKGINPFVHGSVMMRATAYRQLAMGFRFSNPIEDFDLWLRMAQVGDFGMVEKPLYFYRMHSGSISSNTFNFRSALCKIALELDSERLRIGRELPETVEKLRRAIEEARSARAVPEDFSAYSSAIECLRSGDLESYYNLMKRVSRGSGLLARRARWHVLLKGLSRFTQLWYRHRLSSAPGAFNRKLPRGMSFPEEIKSLWAGEGVGA